MITASLLDIQVQMRAAGRRCRVYVAGPYTAPTAQGVAANVQAAVAVGVELRRLGFVPLVPHITIPGAEVTWKEAMVECVSHLRTCDFAVLLPGWERSRGACVEAWLCRRRRGFPLLVSLSALEQVVQAGQEAPGEQAG